MSIPPPEGAELPRKEAPRALETHTRACAPCQVRERYVREHLPPLPAPPVSGWMEALARFAQAVERLPRWARPAAWGAAAIGAITLLRALLLMVGAGPSWKLLGMAALGVAAGAYLGAVGGLTYYTVRDTFRRFGPAAPYLTGVAVATAYLLAFGIPDLLLGDDPLLADPVGWVAGALCAVFFGLVIGHSWFRET